MVAAPARTKLTLAGLSTVVAIVLAVAALPQARGDGTRASADDEGLVRYLTAGKLQFTRQQTQSGRCPARCVVYRFVCSADCSVKTTTRITLPGADVVRRIPGSYQAGVPRVIAVTPGARDRRRILRNLAKAKVKTKLKARGNLGGLDLDLRTFRFKR